MKTLYLLTLITFGLIACGSKTDVIGVGDGKFEILSKHEEKIKSVDKARTEAIKFCEKRNRVAQIVNEETTYEGQMDEDAAIIVRKAGDMAAVLGVDDGYAGSRAATSDAQYMTRLTFMCQ
jgi:hypothetical protein